MGEDVRTATATTTPADARRPIAGRANGRDELANSVLGDRYQIERRIGAGGMGVVYAGRDMQLDRAVAIKIVNRPDDSYEARERLVREARAMAKLRHPNVATVHDVGTTSDRFFIVMELVESGTLADWLKAARRPWRQIVPYFLQAARGLAAAHAAGIVHRDFKPENVLLGKDGVVRVTDFGVVRLVGDPDLDGDAVHPAAPSDTVTGGVVGTAGYIAPEILRQEGVDARADQFSFCVALYAALCGKRPFEITNGASPISESLGPIRPIPHGIAPRWLQRIIRRGLSPSPLHRWPSMSALAAEIERYLGRHRRALVLLGAASIVVLAAALLLRQKDPVATRYDELPLRPLTFTGNARSLGLSPDGQTLVYITEKRVHLVDRATYRDLTPSGVTVGAFVREYRRWLPDSSAFEIVAVVDSGLPSDRAYAGVRIRRDDGAASLFPPFWRGGYSRGGEESASAKIIWHEIEIYRGDRLIRTLPVAGSYDALIVYEWSPNGKWLLVGTVAGDKLTVGLLGADGGPLNELYEQELVDGREPHFAPGGAGVLYLRWRSHEAQDLMFLPLANGRPSGASRVLVDGIPAEDFSVDDGGKSLAYTRSTPASKLWSLSIDDHESARPSVRANRVLADMSSKKAGSISPDGERIVYIAQKGRSDELFVTSAHEGHPQSLSTPPGNKCGAAWSPDGKELAFVIAEAQGTYSLWVTAAAGGPARQLATAPKACDLHWAPQPTIAVSSSDTRNVIIVDPSTGAERPLLRDASMGWVSHPVWSPDGARVALYWNRKQTTSKDGGKGIWLVSADGQSAHRAAKGSYIPLGWSTDGDWIYAASPGDSNSLQQLSKTIVRIPVAGGDAEPWVTLPIEETVEDCSMSPGGRQIECIAGAESDVWLIEDFDKLLRG